MTHFIDSITISKPIILKLHSLVYPKIKSILLASCVSCCFRWQRWWKTRENITDTENITDCLQTLNCWQTKFQRNQWLGVKTEVYQSDNVFHQRRINRNEHFWRREILNRKWCCKFLVSYMYVLHLYIDISKYLQMKINKVVLKIYFYVFG